MAETRRDVEKQLDALTAKRRQLLDAEERTAREVKARAHAAARADLTALLKDYQDAEAGRQECMRLLFEAVREWDQEHPGARVSFGNAHIWQGSALRFGQGEAERALLKPLDCRIVQFDL